MRLVRLLVGRTSGPGLERLAVAQAMSGAADALVAVSLVGSLFFSLSPEASQQQVLLYLLINMAPYVVLAPLVGSAIDRLRHGPGTIAAFIFAVRAACAIGLALSLLELGLYFFALALLIAAKATGIVRQALMPSLVRDPSELVAANSRLATIGIIAGTVGAAVGAGVLAIGSPEIVAGIAGAFFFAAAVAALRLPGAARIAATDVPASVTYDELHRPTIVATSWAFTAVRAAVGFFVFGLAFALRRESEPAWMYGATIGLYGAGSFAGNIVAPVVRRRYGEDRLTAGALIGLAVVAAFGALGQSRPLVLVVATALGAAASLSRQGFDALVQSRAPTATHGRVFARFETRFQVAWVIGAVIATASGLPIRVSLAILAAGLLPAAAQYVRALREAHRAHAEDPFDPREVARRRLDHAQEWHRRGLDRLAVTELAGVVDLGRASGVQLPTAAVVRMDELRATALSTWPLDERAVDWALAEAGEIVARLDDPPQGPVQGSGTTDDDVTVHSEERSASVRTAFDESPTER
ncbi:MAG: MFS transporter [Ilumatobacteraceae bacterium]